MLRAAGMLVALVACGDKTLTMTLQLPADQDRWDTSCVQTIEVYTEGGNYPEQSDDFILQTLDTSDDRPQTFTALRNQVRGKFDVAIPDSGLSGLEMYGWNGPSGFFAPTAFPELVFYSRVEYDGGDIVGLPLVPNIDCRTSSITVRPIDLIKLVTQKTCAAAAILDTEQGEAYMWTLSPSLYKEYLFQWGGLHGAPVAGGVAAFNSSTMVGPGSCLAIEAFSMTSYSMGCISPLKACATGAEVEAVLIDDAYAQGSLDNTILAEFRGGVIGAVIDGTKTPIAGATVTIDPTKGKVVFVNLDTAAQRLTPVAGTATTVSGMFIIYSNDLVEATVTANGATKKITVGAARTANDGTKMQAGVVVPF